MKAKVTKPKLYSLTITLENVVLKGKGETALLAIRSIEPPIKIFTKGLIEMKYDGKKIEMTWTVVKMRNLFRKISQPILAKQFEYLLKR